MHCSIFQEKVRFYYEHLEHLEHELVIYYQVDYFHLGR